MGNCPYPEPRMLPSSPKTNKRAVLFCAAATTSLIMLDTNIVAVALPTIGRELRASFTGLEWVISAYLITFAALLLPAGSLGDLHGRRRCVTFGVALFLVSSAVCGLANSMTTLELARAVQGIGASLLLTSALAIIASTFVGEERRHAYAVWGTSLGAAMTFGPIAGGLITGLFGWRWAFLINVPVCALLLVAIRAFVPESRDPHAGRFDFGGVATLSIALFCLVWALIEGNARGWNDLAILICLGAALLAFAAFLLIERAQKRPMLDLEVFRKRAYLGAASAMFGYGASAQVLIFFLPLYLQGSMNLSALVAGVAMLPFALPLVVAPPLAARGLRNLSHRAHLLVGLGIVAIGDVALAVVTHSTASYAVVAIAMLIAGIGTGILNPETARALQAQVSPDRAGMASGVGATIRFVSLLLGVAVLGAVIHRGFPAVTFLAAGLAASAFLATATLLGRSAVESGVIASHAA